MTLRKMLFVVLTALLLASFAAFYQSAADGPGENDGKDKPAEKGEATKPAESGEKVQLKFSLKKGESYKLKMSTDQKISQDIMGMKQDMTQAFTMVFRHDVEAVDDKGEATIKVTYESVSYKSESPMGKVEYDSTKPPAEVPAMAKGYAALVGQGFTMKMTPNGTLTDIKGIAAMLENMLKKMELPEGPEKALIEKNLKKQFTDEAMKEQMQSSLAIFPDKPVGVGDSWEKKFSGMGMFPCIVENTWTLKSRKDGVATIDVISKVKPDPDGKPVDMGVVKLTYKLSGEMSGSTKVKESTGWAVSSKIKQKISGTVKMESPAMGEEGMSFPISIDSTITIESVEK